MEGYPQRVKTGIRGLLLVLVGALLLVAAPSALGDETAYQLVVPPTNGIDCAGFPHETIGGAVTGCTPDSAGLGPWAFFSVSADGSVVFQASDGPGDGIWLAHPADRPWSSTTRHGLLPDHLVRRLEGRLRPLPTPRIATRAPTQTVNVSDIYSISSDGSDLQLVASGQGTQDLRAPADLSRRQYGRVLVRPRDHNGDLSSRKDVARWRTGSSRNSGAMRVDVNGNNRRMIGDRAWG